MMSPDTEADNTDSRHTLHHTLTTKDITKRARHKTKDGQDNDVDLRMSKEPEQMLLENRITTKNTILDTSPVVSIHKQTSNSNTKNRKRTNEKECSDHK